MARRSGRLSTGKATASTSSHKRQASNVASPIATTKRTKTVATAKAAELSSAGDSDVEASEDEAEASDFTNDAVEPASSDDEASEDFTATDSEFESKRERKNKTTPSQKRGKVNTVATKARQTSKDTASIEPGVEFVTKRPVAHPPGNTPYRDEYLHPNTFRFLGDLKANNQRSWLKFHDAQFRQAERDWFSFVEKLGERLTDIDDTVPELPVKDIIFRIYRDVRFSKDPTPYKPHFSAAWSRTGRKSQYAVYYLQISPGDSFIGGGLWHPDADRVSRLRSAIDRDSRSLKNVLMIKRVRDAFLQGQSNEKAAVKAFIKGSSQDALKTKPKGYDGEHPDIALLRLRSFLLGKKLPDEVVIGRGGLERIADLFQAIEPFVTYLNSVVMPDADEGHESGNESSEDGDENSSDLPSAPEDD